MQFKELFFLTVQAGFAPEDKIRWRHNSNSFTKNLLGWIQRNQYVNQAMPLGLYDFSSSTKSAWTMVHWEWTMMMLWTNRGRNDGRGRKVDRVLEYTILCCCFCTTAKEITRIIIHSISRRRRSRCGLCNKRNHILHQVDLNYPAGQLIQGQLARLRCVLQLSRCRHLPWGKGNTIPPAMSVATSLHQ